MAKVAQRITQEEWERKTHLDEDQKQSVCEIREACKELPLPSHWFPSERSLASPVFGRSVSSGVSTPDSLPGIPSAVSASGLSNRLYALSPTRSRSTTNLLAESNAAESAAGKRSAMEVGSDKPIETLQQFFEWFSIHETDMEREQDDVCRTHLSTMILYQKACDDFLNDIQTTITLFDDLKDSYQFIEKQTRPLQSECETLLTEQEQLTKLADGLSERLSYFNQLEPIAMLFNSPGDDICCRPEFAPMLETLDKCIQYVQSHPNYHDFEPYRTRFDQCMSRGMTLIQMYTTRTIKELGDQLKRDATAKSVEYVKFNTIAPTIRALVGEIKKRPNSDTEYHHFYDEIIDCYTRTRQQLLGPSVSQKVKELNKTCVDLLPYIKQLCAYMKSICSDEISLFDKFFHSGHDEKLRAYLDSLTSIHYNAFYRVKREQDVSVLSELCDFLHIYTSHDSGYLAQDPKHMRATEIFGRLIHKLWEDSRHQLQSALSNHQLMDDH